MTGKFVEKVPLGPARLGAPLRRAQEVEEAHRRLGPDLRVGAAARADAGADGRGGGSRGRTAGAGG